MPLWLLVGNVAITDCATARDGVAVLRRDERWPWEGVDGDLWARASAALPQARWVPARLSASEGD